VHTLYVNTEYGNSVTLDATMASEIDDFGNLTWRELLVDVIGESLEYLLQDDHLLDYYRIEKSQLDCALEASEVDRFYSQISFHADNKAGAEALAFNLLHSLQLFPMDKDGNGSHQGVSLDQTYANGPRKYVIIADESAAIWLTAECASRGLEVDVEFV
jgi:hypothetical protein